MKRRMLVVLTLSIIGCGKKNELSDFKSDGCSMFLDKSLINEEDWCLCCYEHDIAYWQGGTEEERRMADERLRDCVLKRTGNEDLADIMYEAVRFGGSPYFYNWYRWGYGWSFDRGYRPLSEREKALVRRKLSKIAPSYSGQICD